MDETSTNKAASRIENVSQEIKDVFQDAFRFILKEREYEYLTQNLISLSGLAHKKKRAAVNAFSRERGDVVYRNFCGADMRACLDLYMRWQEERAARYKDDVYRSMLRASYFSHRRAMLDYERLGLIGKVVEVDGSISAYSFGYPLNESSFCVLLEIADLHIKGLAQFIFREFSSDMKNFRYINAGDDSGLNNIARAKLSYRPTRVIPSYIILPR